MAGENWRSHFSSFIIHRKRFIGKQPFLADQDEEERNFLCICSLRLRGSQSERLCQTLMNTSSVLVGKAEWRIKLTPFGDLDEKTLAQIYG